MQRFYTGLIGTPRAFPVIVMFLDIGLTSGSAASREDQEWCGLGTEVVL